MTDDTGSTGYISLPVAASTIELLINVANDNAQIPNKILFFMVVLPFLNYCNANLKLKYLFTF